MSGLVHLLCGKFLAATLVHAVSVQSQQLLSVTDGNFEGTIIPDYIRQRAPGSPPYCQLLCLKDKECISFFHNPVTDICQTHDVVFFNPVDGQISQGTRYYRHAQDFCPSALGYIYKRAFDFCYKLHYLNDSLPSEARQVCQDEVADVDYNGFLIGATDKGYAAGDWHWSNGQQVDLHVWNWCPNAPNRSSSDNVAMQVSKGYPPACVKKVLSSAARHFVCERQM